MPTRRADPSVSGNSPRTVPVPNVLIPTIWARPASWMAPDTISDELAVPPSTSTTSGRSVATPPGVTGWVVSLPSAPRSTKTVPLLRNWLATASASLT